MLLERSVLNIADNSGATKVMLFAVNGKNNRQSVKIGDVVMGSVKKATPNGKIAKGRKVKVLIVRTRRKLKRPDGSSIRFSDNAGVIIGSGNDPVATRIFGPVARELKDSSRYSKVVSLAEEVL